MTTNNRTKLRPWLEKQLRLGCCKGLEWIDEQEGEFKIQYPRFGKTGIDVKEDFAVFQRWATYTGLYNEATNDPDPKRWKANLRNALGKGKDFIEIRGKRSRPGDGPIPYRVYKIVDQHSERIQGKRSMWSKNEDLPMPDSTTHGGETGGGGPSEEMGGDDRTLPDGCPDLALLMSVPDSPTPEQARSFQASPDMLLNESEDDPLVPTSDQEGQIAIETPAPTVYGASADVEPHTPETTKQAAQNTTQQDKNVQMSITVRYLNETVLSTTTSSSSGCRISHGRHEGVSKKYGYTTEEGHALVFGSCDAEDVVLPAFCVPHSFKIEQGGLSLAAYDQKARNGEKVLEKTMRGLEFITVNGYIYAKRFCKSGVICTSEQIDFTTKELPRETREYVKLFDYQAFSTQLEKWVENPGTVPHPYVYLAFGQKEFASNTYIYVAVASKLSLDVLLQHGIVGTPLDLGELAENVNMSLLFSKTNEHDKMASDVNGLLNYMDNFRIDEH